MAEPIQNMEISGIENRNTKAGRDSVVRRLSEVIILA
jgi:hypothetical protein